MTEWTTGEWYLAVTCKHRGWQFPLSRADQTLPQRPIEITCIECCLFAAYTLMREKPLVVIVTDSNMQLDTHGVSAQDRREESRRGCEVFDVPVVFLGLTDQEVLDEADFRQRLELFMGQDWPRVCAGSPTRARPS